LPTNFVAEAAMTAFPNAASTWNRGFGLWATTATNAAMMVHGYDSTNNNYMQPAYRDAAAGATANAGDAVGGVASATAPYIARMVRVGDTVTPYYVNATSLAASAMMARTVTS